jgi:hypothetical protein
MRKVAFVAVLVIAAVVMMGCPSFTIPTGVTSNTIGSKTGTSSGQVILGLVGHANGSVADAAKSAGITKISTVDTTVKLMVGPVIITVTTTVTGD